MEQRQTVQLPRLRPGLRFTPTGTREEPRFILEDTTRHLYYRIGLEEYLFITFLDQADSLEQLVDRVAAASGTGLTPEQAMTILGWLRAKQLLQADSPESLDILLRQEEQVRAARRLNRMNLISFKLPLANPDPLLEKICPRLSWLSGPWFAVLWAIAGLAGLTVLLTHWDEFHSQLTGFFAPVNLFILWLIWLGLKILHEFFHALVCYRYGGRVYEAGILFILFIPLTYVDATTSWKFPSRWQRIHVASAGMFIELGVAWLALLVWVRAPDSAVGLIAHRTVLIAGISSLLFNANPLMRFDGYYILSDLVGIPNLYQLGIQRVRDWFSHLLLGIRAEKRGDEEHALFINIYGICVYCWRFLVLASLGYLASTLFHGLGIVITLAAVLVWVATPIHSLISRWPRYREQNPHVLRDLLVRGSLLAILVGILVVSVGWRRTVRAPAVVEYVEQVRVRAQTAGFIRSIMVHDGDQVNRGQTLVKLEQPELIQALRDTELQIEQLAVRSRMAHNSGRFSEVQVLRAQKQALERRLQQQKEQRAALTVVSAIDGTVIGHNLDQLAGTYVGRGRELFWVVRPDRKQLRGSVGQNDISYLRNLAGQPVDIDMRRNGQGWVRGRITRIAPTASTKLPDPALAAKYGGPLDVLERRLRNEQTGTDEVQMELFQPRFNIEVELPPEEVEHLWAGQLGFICARGERVTLLRKIQEVSSGWFRRKQQAAAARQ